MGAYDPNAIAESYSQGVEIDRAVRSADAAVMFEIERWFIEQNLPGSGTVIDVGGGPGRFAIEIAKLGRDVVLTDITPKHIEQAKELATQEGVAERFVDYQVLDVLDLSQYTDSQFTMALCYGMLNYTLGRAPDVLSELGRIVKPGNPILVSVMGLYGAIRLVWARGSLPDSEYRERERRVLAAKGLNEHRQPARQFYTAETLRHTIETAGLELTDIAATPAICGSIGAQLEAARDDKNAWEYVIEMEKRSCRTPGLLDCGQHIIAVARKPVTKP